MTSEETDMWSFGASHVWRALLAIAAVVLVGASPMPTAAHADPPGRLFYEIVVTDPGTKSQGWHGVLYDADGNPIEAAPGQTVSLAGQFLYDVGEFVNVACDNPWDACGMIRADMVSHRENRIDMTGWVYRLFVFAEGSKSELWAGTLLHDGWEIPPRHTPVDTPMGAFRTGGPMPSGWAVTGWFPVSWQL